MKRPNPKDVNPYDSKAYKRTKEYLRKKIKNRHKERNHINN